jgi:phosphate-selective porin OprO/OprP
LRRWRFFTRGDVIALVPFSYSLSVMAVDNTQFVLDDVFLEFRRIPYLGTLRVGSFIPAMSLEASGSSRDSTFMEWGTAIQALAPRISAGFQVGQPVFGGRATWTLGQFGESLGTDVGDATRDFYRIIARGTWLPFDGALAGDTGFEHLLHLGLNVNYLRSGSADIRYRSRPEAFAAPFLADTGFIAARNMESYGLEAAWVKGPWSIQGEYLQNFVSDEVDGTFHGFYVYSSYFLTGESRAYDRSRGVFGRLRPYRNLSFGGEGWGALETGLRFSYLDLDDGAVRGGILRNMTAGMNWYFHPNSKLRFNYVYAQAGGGPREGDLHIFESRFEFDF